MVVTPIALLVRIAFGPWDEGVGLEQRELLAPPDAQRVEDLTALLTSAGER